MAKTGPVKVRRWRPEDIPALIACHAAAYADYPKSSHYDRRLYEMQLNAFPEGQLLAECRGEVVGYATSLIVQLDEDRWYTYEEVTGSATFSTHFMSGDTLYGADLAIHPDWRGRGIAGMLYKRRLVLLKRHNLRRMVAYGRIPGYQNQAGRMTAEEYVARVSRGELKDQALNAHLKAGYKVKRVLLKFMSDATSLNYSTLLELLNDDFRPEKRNIAAAPLKRPVRKIRVCAAQYQLRSMKTWEEFEESVSFFVNVADEYHCHFLLFPELFCVQLFSTMPRQWDYVQLMTSLAEQSDRLLDLFVRKAKETGLFIIAGSQPVLRDGALYNVAHLVSPTGNVYSQDKLHITPSERQAWGIQPGSGLKLFDTPLGRTAIQICYDIEFPEASRLLTLAGAEVIFVPFSTDELRAYLRVRYCAQARSVENYLFTVLAGNVGNLPNKSYLINYGQAAIFTPSDFPFPQRAIAGEADPNAETVVIGELDLSSLDELRDVASVRPLHDRRTDLYTLKASHPIEVIRVE